MADPSLSVLDGSLLLPMEQMTAANMGTWKGNAPLLQQVSTYMQTVYTAVSNYQSGYTTKIVLNPSDLQTYIGSIRTLTASMAGGYGTDGTTKITAQAQNILPDILTTLRNNQLYLCQLYANYVDSQGALVGPLDTTQIEDTSTGGFTV